MKMPVGSALGVTVRMPSHRNSRLLATRALAVLASFISVYAQGQTAQQVEELFDRKEQEGYAAARASGNEQLMNMYGIHHRQKMQETQRIFDDAEAALGRMELGRMAGGMSDLGYMSWETRQLRELQANDAANSFTVDDAMWQFAHSDKLLVAAARDSASPDDPDISLQMPEEFWTELQRKRRTKAENIAYFYKRVIEKYFTARSPQEKCHWFLYAVKVSGKSRLLEQLLRDRQNMTFVQSLAELYDQAEQPALKAYFNPTQASTIEKFLAEHIPRVVRQDGEDLPAANFR